MLSTDELKKIAAARLQDAKALLKKHRHDGSVYLCGYAVEIALKAAIVVTEGREGFPEDSAEFESMKLEALKIHDRDKLLIRSGCETIIRHGFMPDWSNLTQHWNPQSRYRRTGEMQIRKHASSIVKSADVIVSALLRELP
jgi:hypothetical protein